MTSYFMLPRIVSGIGVIYDTSLCCDKFLIELTKMQQEIFAV